MLRLAEHKNLIIKYALDKGYDALFFVDSDLILEPTLLEHLAKAGKEIISEIFWICWHPGRRLEPNVWLFDEYNFSYIPNLTIHGEDRFFASEQRCWELNFW